MASWIRSNVLGLVAIFIALSGTAVATQAVSDQAATSKKQKAKRGPAGPAGPQGPQGAQGPPGPSTGPAGGDLTGAYPNPSLAPAVVGAAEIQDFSIGTEEFAFDIPWARATHDSDQSIPNATDTTLAFNDERFDSVGLHDTVTNNSRMTAPASGAINMFYVSAQIQFASNGTGLRTVTIMRNDGFPIARETVQAVSGAPTTVNVSTLAVLSGGGSSYLEVVVRQTSGGALNVIEDIEASPEFSMIYLPSND